MMRRTVTAPRTSQSSSDATTAPHTVSAIDVTDICVTGTAATAALASATRDVEAPSVVGVVGSPAASIGPDGAVSAVAPGRIRSGSGDHADIAGTSNSAASVASHTV